MLTTINVRLLPDGRVAAKAYGRPVAGGRGTYVSFPVPDSPALRAHLGGSARARSGGASGAMVFVANVDAEVPARGRAWQGPAREG